MKKILIIDDEVNVGQLLTRFLSKHGFTVNTATSGNKGFDILKNERHDLVLCDFRLEDADGKEMLKNIKSLYPSTIVIIITGYSDVKMAVELIKGGAYDYITKPLYPDEILNTINKAFEHAEALGGAEFPVESRGSMEQPSSKADLKKTKGVDVSTDGYIKGESTAAKELYKQIDLVAPTDYSIILFGESGTGKESVAHRIHEKSDRRNKPFIPVDCGALPRELAVSELFGHEKGSFTGAIQTRTGYFEQANGGTLFLDEIGNLTYDVQVALLRLVQERKIKKIGSAKEIELDIRFIIASNENLWEAVQKGKFREDLFHRFNEFNINIPPLRNRGNDILIFAEYFLSVVSSKLSKQIEGFTEEVKARFLDYAWPGNIRELQNVVRKVCLMTENQEMVDMKYLPMELLEMSPSLRSIKDDKELLAVEEENFLKPNLKNAALEAEYETILQVLKQVNFNKTKAAKLLKIDRKTLYNKMKAINVDVS